MMRGKTRWWVSVLIVLLLASYAGAQGNPIEEGLAKLPVSVGQNTQVMIPKDQQWMDTGISLHVGYEHLSRANPQGVKSGMTVLVPGRHQVAGLVNDGLVVNLPELMIFRWEDGKPVAWDPISVGRITSRWHTPVGELSIVNRVVNPTWHRPSWAGGGVVPPGPRNPLGDRWIGLNQPGYGIHGSNDPTSIGRTVSQGCIRMFPPHIHELFAHTQVGLPVFITYETVTVGQQDGVVFLAIFPDIYGRGSNSSAQVLERLSRYGLSGALRQQELERVIQRADGVARPMLGSDMAVSLNSRVLSMPIGPTIRDGVSYLPLRQLSAELQATVSWDAATKTATVTRGETSLTYQVPGDRAFLAFGTTFVALRPLVEEFGGSVGLKGRVIEIAI